MDAIGRQHYKMNTYLLLTIGMWPYTNTKIRQIQIIFVSFILCIGVIMQLATFVTCKYNMKLFLKNLSPICMNLGCAFKYLICWFQMDNVKVVLEQLRHDWTTINVEEEVTIVKEHAETAKYYTKVFALFLYAAMFGFMLSLFASDFLNIIVPLNESRPHEFPVMFETIIDQQKHYYFVVLFGSIILFAVTTTFIALEGLSFICLQHTASMFKIVSYRIREAVMSDLVKKDGSGNEFDTRKFASAMKMHRTALIFQNYFKTKFALSYFVLLALGIASLSINMFRFSQALDTLNDINELFISCFTVLAELTYMYSLNYVIETVIDSSNDVFMEVYNVRWTEVPVTLQKLLLFIMVVNVKSIGFSVCGIYDASIEGFSKLFKLTLSYFMVLRSVQ